MFERAYLQMLIYHFLSPCKMKFIPDKIPKIPEQEVFNIFKSKLKVVFVRKARAFRKGKQWRKTDEQ